MTTTVTAKIVPRQGTAAAWTSANPTLLFGERGMETDTGYVKLGDGVTEWNDLDYSATEGTVAAHIVSTANPHSVTASQVGALTSAAADLAYAAIGHDHSGVYEPAEATILKQADVDDTPVNGVTTAPVSSNWAYDHAALTTAHGISTFGASLVDDDDAGTARSTLGLGTAATTASTDYATATHNHTSVYEPAGTAASAIASHEGAADPHTGYALESSLGGSALLNVGTTTGTVAAGDDARFSTGTTGDAFASSHPGGNQHIDWTADQGATDLHAGNIPDLSGTYATAAKGVTNGDSHDHSGGDGAQIAYSGLSGLPTLGTAAATDTTAYVAAGADAADLTSGAATDGQVLTADGAGGAAWEAAAVTYAGAASEIHAAADKATPVDADELGLVDSAASWVLKKLTWANLKTTLAGVFPLLAGKTGGQTIVGGTGVTDALSLQGTSGNGTVTSTALAVKVGNNGALTALTVANNGQLAIQGDATTDLPVYGSELLTSAGWTVNTGWTESPDDTFAHTSGTDTLTHSATITSSHKYQISWTVTGRTAGSFTVAVGGQSIASQTATGTFGPTATATTAFTITPTTDFNGTLSLVSLKQITAVSTPERVIKNSAGTIIGEERFVGTNISSGINAGGYLTTGINNNCLGYQAGTSITTGGSNNCLGYQAGIVITTGSSNNCLGYLSGRVITTGNSNNCFGYQAGTALTTGSSNNCFGTNTGGGTTGGSNNSFGSYAGAALTTGGSNNCFGSYAGYSITTGGSNNCFGINAGRHHADGATALTDPEYSIYIGYAARGKDNSDNNSVVIGGNTPIGLGANTTVIGTSATTLTRLFGDIGLGVDAPSAKVHALKTTEQLRLGYDASNYASFTVSSTGNLTLDTVGNTIYTPDTIENTTAGGGIILKSPDGTRYLITVANGGTLSVTAA